MNLLDCRVNKETILVVWSFLLKFNCLLLSSEAGYDL